MRDDFLVFVDGFWKMYRNFQPTIICNFSGVIQYHCAKTIFLHNFPEQTFVILNTYCYKI